MPALAFAPFLLLAGCISESEAVRDGSTPDATASDASTVDGFVDPVDGAVDAGDSGSMAGDSTPSAPAEIVRTGTSGVLLRGVVLTETGVLDPGEVLVVGDTITCVAASCADATGANDATLVDTHGVISPGLVDAHNHLGYNFLGEWVPPMLYGNRYEWADEDSYEEFVKPYADNRSTGSTYCPAAKWGELRSLIHGTTTVMGQSFQQGCVNVFVRNPDHYDGLGGEQLSTYIGSVRDINDSTATSLVTRFSNPTTPLRRYAVHMAEGIAGSNIDLEFDSFAGRDTRSNRHMGTSLLAGENFSGVAVLIHSVPLTEGQLMEAAVANAKFVWSPSSNMVLYGQTADIATWLSLGVTIGMGPDWTPSGEDDMLAELRFARSYGSTVGIEALTPRRLWEMATLGSADVVGLADSVGKLAVGMRADITVIGRTGGDPYAALIDADARDVRLTMIDGRVYYGDASLESALALNGECEALTACGADKFLCVKDVPQTQSGSVSRASESLTDVEGQLLAILGNYGRTDLLPLVHECAEAD